MTAHMDTYVPELGDMIKLAGWDDSEAIKVTGRGGDHLWVEEVDGSPGVTLRHRAWIKVTP